MAVKRQIITDRYAIYNGDCIEVMQSLPDESFHGSIYSAAVRRALPLLVRRARPLQCPQLRRVLRALRVRHPREVPAHPAGPDQWRSHGTRAHGQLGQGRPTRTSPGDVIRAHQRIGWDFIARHVIWKEPLAVRNRTMQHNLSHRTIVEDGSMGGVASPDELLVFRKPGAAKPVTHPTGLHGEYAGSEQVPSDLHRYRAWEGDQKANRYSHFVWRRYASSVWDDVRIDRVLPFQDAKDEDDEKHVHPLQLDVIERYLDLRTHARGAGTHPVHGRRVGGLRALSRWVRFGVGAELKPSYFEQAVRKHGGRDDVADAAQDDLLSLA